MITELKVNYIITSDNIVLNYNSESHIIPKTEVVADKIIECIKNKEWDKIPDLVDLTKVVSNYVDGNFQIKNGVAYINDFELPNILNSKILEFMEMDLPYYPLVAFAKNLMKNPSNTSLMSLYRFLDYNNHPITDDGNFIAYKLVRSDFTDIFSGKFDNSPGNIVEVLRNQVDENVDVTCSYGLHVANWDYAHNRYMPSKGNVMIEVKVNPADVVAVPRDYNNSKMRVCRYEVIGEVANRHKDEELLRNTCSSNSLRYEETDCIECGNPCNDDLCNSCRLLEEDDLWF